MGWKGVVLSFFSPLSFLLGFVYETVTRGHAIVSSVAVTPSVREVLLSVYWRRAWGESVRRVV